MVVLAVTYCEAFIAEYLQALFLTHPQRMREVLCRDPGVGPDERKLLSTVLKSSSKDDILLQLANDAAAIAGRGPIRKVLHRTAKLPKASQYLDLERALVELHRLRNKILYDGEASQVDENGVKQAFLVVGECLSWLHDLALANRIEVFDLAFISRQQSTEAL